MKEHTENGMDMPVLRNESKADDVTILARFVRGIESRQYRKIDLAAVCCRDRIISCSFWKVERSSGMQRSLKEGIGPGQMVRHFVR